MQIQQFTLETVLDLLHRFFELKDSVPFDSWMELKLEGVDETEDIHKPHVSYLYRAEDDSYRLVIENSNKIEGVADVDPRLESLARIAGKIYSATQSRSMRAFFTQGAYVSYPCDVCDDVNDTSMPSFINM